MDQRRHCSTRRFSGHAITAKLRIGNLLGVVRGGRGPICLLARHVVVLGVSMLLLIASRFGWVRGSVHIRRRGEGPIEVVVMGVEVPASSLVVVERAVGDGRVSEVGGGGCIHGVGSSGVVHEEEVRNEHQATVEGLMCAILAGRKEGEDGR